MSDNKSNVKGKLKFIIKTEKAITADKMDELRLQLEKLEEGTSEVLIINDSIYVAVLDENNNLVTLL